MWLHGLLKAWQEMRKETYNRTGTQDIEAEKILKISSSVAFILNRGRIDSGKHIPKACVSVCLQTECLFLLKYNKCHNTEENIKRMFYFSKYRPHTTKNEPQKMCVTNPDS